MPLKYNFKMVVFGTDNLPNHLMNDWVKSGSNENVPGDASPCFFIKRTSIPIHSNFATIHAWTFPEKSVDKDLKDTYPIEMVVLVLNAQNESSLNHLDYAISQLHPSQKQHMMLVCLHENKVVDQQNINSFKQNHDLGKDFCIDLVMIVKTHFLDESAMGGTASEYNPWFLSRKIKDDRKYFDDMVTKMALKIDAHEHWMKIQEQAEQLHSTFESIKERVRTLCGKEDQDKLADSLKSILNCVQGYDGLEDFVENRNPNQILIQKALENIDKISYSFKDQAIHFMKSLFKNLILLLVSLTLIGLSFSLPVYIRNYKERSNPFRFYSRPVETAKYAWSEFNDSMDLPTIK